MVKILNHVGIMNMAGQETYLMNVLRTIDREKYQLDFLCNSSESGAYDKEIFSLNSKIFIKKTSATARNKISKYYNDYCSLRDTLLELEYDYYELHTYHAFDALISTLAAKRAGFKNVIIHSHNNNGEHPYLHYFSRFFLKFLNTIKLACSKEAGDWMFGKNGKFTVIPNGINMKEFCYSETNRIEKRRELSIDENTFVIIHIGRFENQKNHQKLITIFNAYLNKHKNSLLLLIGKGSLEDEIKSEVKNLNIKDNVRFLENRNDISQLLSASDCFVFPSLYEGLGIVIIEALSSNLPCVITDTLPDDLDMSKLVYRVSLNCTDEEWVERIQSNPDRNKNVDFSYDIIDTVKKLTVIYK